MAVRRQHLQELQHQVNSHPCQARHLMDPLPLLLLLELLLQLALQLILMIPQHSMRHIELTGK